MLEDVSACIIAKNEEQNLPRLLESIKGKFFEIILVDTGSTDKTVEIAQSYGCKVFHREWSGFADARNFAVEKASGKWVWHFDADTELENSEYERFKTFYTYMNKELYEGISVLYKNTGIDGRIKSYSTTVHIHKKSNHIRWIGKIHERVLNINTYTIVIPEFKVNVLHYGYSMGKIQREKAIRNLKLIFDEIRSIKDKGSIDYSVNLFYAIQSYIALASIENREKNLRRSIKYIEKFEKLLNLFPKESIFIKHFFVYASSIYLYLNDLENAGKYVDEGLGIDPDYPDLLYNRAKIYENQKNYDKAVDYYISFLNSTDSLKSKTDSVITDFMMMAKSVSLKKLPEMIIQNNLGEKVEKIENLWKQKRGLYIGLLLYSVELLRDKNKAEKILMKLYKIYDDSDIVYSILGDFLMDKDTHKAIQFMMKAIELNPINPEANLFFAQLYEKNGDLFTALTYYKNYLEATRDISLYSKVEELLNQTKKNFETNDNKIGTNKS